MTRHDPTFRIDPIEPGQVGPRFTALIDRLEPLLDADDVRALRSLVAAGDYAAAFDRLDSITDDGSITVETSMLVELVLLGQAGRSAGELDRSEPGRPPTRTTRGAA